MADDKLDIDGVADLVKDLASKKLSDKKLKKDLLSKTVSKEFSASRSRAPKVTVTAKPGASAGIELYNDAGDADDDGVLGAKPKDSDGGDQKLKLPPVVEFDPNASAWLKYRVDAGLHVAGSGSLEQLGFKFSVTKDAGLVLADYRRHDRGDVAGMAIGADLLTPRVAFSTGSVMAMDVGDALAMAVRGSLSAGVEISWSDVFASQFGGLSQILKTSELIALNFKAGATASFKVELKADFRLVVARHSVAEWRVGVLRQKTESMSGSFAAGVTVEISNPSALKKAITTAIDGILDAKLTTLRNLIAKGWDELKPKQKELVEEVLERLGVPNPTDAISELEQRLDKIQEDVGKKVKELVESKVKAGFTYEYSRVAASGAMLMVRVPKAVMQKRHAELIKGSLDGVLTDAIAGKAFVETFMNQSSRKVSMAYGFTLGLGKWKVGGKDSDEFERVQTKVLAKPGDTVPTKVRRSYKGQHRYDADWIGEDFNWAADFKAAMDEPSAGEEPRLDEFDYGLHLAFGRQEKLSQNDLRAFIDHGVAWRVLNPGDVDDAYSKLKGALNRKVSTIVQLKIDDEVFLDLLREVAQGDRDELGSAFAAALPWRTTKGREDAQLRRYYYEDVWERFLLEDPNTIDAAEYARITYDQLRDLGAPKTLRWIEAKGLEQGPRRTYTVAGLIDLNSSMRRQADQFLSGTSRFVAAHDNGDLDKGKTSVKKLFGDIKALTINSFCIRALGVHLVDVAASTGRLSDTERTMTLTYGDTSVVMGS